MVMQIHKTFSVGFFIVVVLIISGRFRFAGRHAISLFGPRAQVDHLTASRAKWPVRVVFPMSFGATGRTPYGERHIYESRVPAANSSSTASFFSMSPWSRE